MTKNTTRGADKIISSISNQLVTGKLKAGDRLPAEVKLCQQYTVSRTVVREAIQQLKAIGVVHTITGSGSYITEAGLDGLKNSLEFFSIMTGDTDSWVDLLEMRIVFESDCARSLAGDKFTPKELERIKTVLREMKDNLNDTNLFHKLDVEFHKKLVAAAGNKIYIAILTSLENLHLRFAKETYQGQNSLILMKKNFKEHAAIVKAIENRDPDLAEQTMKKHLHATMDNLQEYISKHAASK